MAQERYAPSRWAVNVRLAPDYGMVAGMLGLPAEVFAVLGAALYFGVSLLVGDRFPFSRYSMYARTANRDNAAAPFFRAAGEDVRMDQYTDFSGLDPRRMRPEVGDCSVMWKVEEAMRWVERHPAPPDAPAEGRVAVEWGFHVITVDDDGAVHEEPIIVLRGTARAW